jgi:hypothetical protein
MASTFFLTPFKFEIASDSKMELFRFVCKRIFSTWSLTLGVSEIKHSGQVNYRINTSAVQKDGESKQMSARASHRLQANKIL